MTEKIDFTFKIVVLGNGGIGKSSLVYKYITNSFLEDFKMTIGVDIWTKNVVWNDKKGMLSIWDMGGQEHFRFLHPNFISGSNGAFICFDLSGNANSFLALDSWMAMLEKAERNIPMILIGTKCDIEGNFLSEYAIQQFLEKYKINHYVKTSGKDGINVEKVFDIIVDELMSKL